MPHHLPTRAQVPSRVLMGPGPSNAHPRVLAAQALPLLGHMHPQFFKVGGPALANSRLALAAAAGMRPVLRGALDPHSQACVLVGLLKSVVKSLRPQIMDEIQKGLRYLFQTDSPYTLCISGTGHAGMEVRTLARLRTRSVRVSEQLDWRARLALLSQQGGVMAPSRPLLSRCCDLAARASGRDFQPA